MVSLDNALGKGDHVLGLVYRDRIVDREEIAGAEDTIFGAVYDEKMGDRIKITVIATGFNQGASERMKGAAEHIRAVGNVIPLTSTDSNKSIDYQLASLRDNLDEPAFKRRRAE